MWWLSIVSLLHFFEKKIEKHIAGLKIIPTFATANEKQRMQSECSAVGSALRSGRRGRAFESPHSDKIKGSFLDYSKLPFNFI